MAAPIAGYARYRSVRRMLLWRLLITLGVVAVLGVASVVSFNFYSSRHPSTNQPNTAPKLSFAAKQALDINLVGGSISQYASANGALPTRLSLTTDGGLVLCGQTCNPLLDEVTGFSAYQPASIKMVSYRPGLAVPDDSTIYLVPSAKCDSSGRLSAPNQQQRSMIILYAENMSKGLTPRCIVL